MTTRKRRMSMMDERGQMTVEAVLVLGFFIFVFFAVTVPMAFDARNTAIDTTVLSDAKFATEQIASAANTVLVNGSRRTIDVYIPGYKSQNVHLGTRICSNGRYLNTTVLIQRTNLTEAHTFSARLYGDNWNITTPDGSAADRILEDEGRRYTLTIEYKNITSNTANTMSGVTKAQTTCDKDFSGSLPTGW